MARLFLRSLNSHLCLNLSSKNISVIEFKRNSMSIIFIVSAYFRPTNNNPE